MENNDSNIKPQQTGGLKLMTVFVVVLALHVVVIGGMTTYYLLKGGSSDADLLADKNHKGLKANADGTLVSDGQMPDSTSTASTATPAPDASASTATPTPTPAPAADQTASTDTSSTPSTPVADTTTPVAPAPSTAATPTPAPTTPVVAATPTPATGAPVTSAAQTTPVTTPSATAVAATPAPAATAVAQVTPTTDGTPYVVKSHDSLARIAHRNHISVASLKSANSLTSDKLSIGQKLMIPAKMQVASAAPATTTEDVATTTTLTPPADSAPAPTENKAKSVAVHKSSMSLTKGTLDHHLYTVVKGDTLTKIAHRFKTTPTALMTANNITDPTKLSIGKKLTIPSRETHTAKVSEPATTQPAQVETKPKVQTAQFANNSQ